MLLLDTSAWVEIFRRPPRLKIEDVGDFDEIVTCLPIVQEVLQGFLDEAAFRTARAAMFSLPVVDAPLGREVFEEAVGLYRAARRSGITLRSSVDCLIAASALRHGLTVVHRDRDFSLLARVSSLAHRDFAA